MRAAWNRRLQYLGISIALVGMVALAGYWDDSALDVSGGGYRSSPAVYLTSLVLLGFPLLCFARHDRDFYDLRVGAGYLPRSRLVDAAVVSLYMSGHALCGQLVLSPLLASKVLKLSGTLELDPELVILANSIVFAYYVLAGLILLVFFVAKLFTPVEIPSTVSASRSRSR